MERRNLYTASSCSKLAATVCYHHHCYVYYWLRQRLPGGPSGKEPACQRRRHKKCDPCIGKVETATHSSILAWRIQWTEEPGGLQSMGPKDSDVTEHAKNARRKNEKERKKRKPLRYLNVHEFSLPFVCSGT